MSLRYEDTKRFHQQTPHPRSTTSLLLLSHSLLKSPLVLILSSIVYMRPLQRSPMSLRSPSFLLFKSISVFFISKLYLTLLDSLLLKELFSPFFHLQSISIYCSTQFSWPPFVGDRNSICISILQMTSPSVIEFKELTRATNQETAEEGQDLSSATRPACQNQT